MLRARAGDERTAFTFLEDGEEVRSTVTFAELDRRARAVAATLRAKADLGERAILLYPQGLEYIHAFFGCAYAGVTAVPAYPPIPSRLARTLPRLQAIAADAGARFVLTLSSIVELAHGLFELAPELKALEWLATDALEPGAEHRFREPQLPAEALAFLQYTSGSTGHPKGVMISHGSVMANLEQIRRSFGQVAGASEVSWLPFYHDMGLVQGILLNVYLGGHGTLLSPLHFLQRPFRWLKAISEMPPPVFSGAPNFAFELCARKVSEEELGRVELSGWKPAYCGAEPIQAEVFERFVDRFALRGFRAEALYPCYGLAEVTLCCSGGGTAPTPRVLGLSALELEHSRVAEANAGERARRVVGLGRPVDGLSVRIVHPDTHAGCREEDIGEVWLQGPNLASGYWNKPGETSAAFGARLASGEGPFLRTGDLGFIAHRELFITGRIKDLLIVRGLKHYPQDIERLAEKSHPSLRPGCSAAFGVGEGAEQRLVLVAELEKGQRPSPGEVEAAAKRAVAESHDIELHEVVLLKPSSIPKTSSGKIQRSACRRDYLDGTLERWVG
ncbi:MAG: fatty acyl-AMP ligase [Myxococcales bacterium]|nr:fatty acyl-AMP ligase [Myxococcales bacterium]